MDERKNDVREMTNEEYRGASPDYEELIIEMVHEIGKNDEKFLMQVYTIIHRHMKKEG